MLKLSPSSKKLVFIGVAFGALGSAWRFAEAYGDDTQWGFYCVPESTPACPGEEDCAFPWQTYCQARTFDGECWGPDMPEVGCEQLAAVQCGVGYVCGTHMVEDPPLPCNLSGDNPVPCKTWHKIPRGGD